MGFAAAGFAVNLSDYSGMKAALHELIEFFVGGLEVEVGGFLV